MRFASCLFLFLLLTACFEIRQVEPPQNNNADWVSPTDYRILLNNLQTAISRQNVQNYLRCFEKEAFRFSPVASLFNDNESVWRNWSLQDEQTYLENTLNNLRTNSGNTLLLQESGLQDVTADSLRYIGNYILRFNHKDTTFTNLFKGQIQLVIQLNSFNEWSITRWTDLETVPDSSWSLLKLQYVQ